MAVYNNSLQQNAGQGQFYTFANEGTRNTGVALTAATGATYSATQAILIVVNTNGSGGPNVYMNYFQIAYDAVNTAGVAGFFYHRLDVGNMYSSGYSTSAGMTGFNMANPGAGPSGVLCYTGALTAAAATTNTRDFYKHVYLNGVGAATPTIDITVAYGALELGMGSQAIPATTAQEVILRCPPVVIAPGMSYIINEFQTSRNAAGTGEFFVGLTVGP